MNRLCQIAAVAVVVASSVLCASAAPPFALPPEEAVSLQDLRHAVACPPFTGLEPYAQLCHGKIVAMLKQASTEIEFLEGTAASAKKAPKFTYRLYGNVSEGRDGTPQVTVSLVDEARHEEVASYTSPISDASADLSSWMSVMRADMRRRVRKMPFECSVMAEEGRTSLTLDRGLSSGLKPGMVFYISGMEEEILDHNTGEVIGRDSPRAYGKIVVYRVNKANAYARPVEGTVLPAHGPFFAYAF